MRYLLLLLSLTLLLSNNSKAQIIHLNEDFNAASLPTGWTNTAVSGTQSWSFGTIGVSSLNGSPMAYFNDDALGSTNTNNTASLTSPSFDNSNDSITYLEFEYNFRQFTGVADSFLVEVFDGTNWQRVRSVGIDDCGNWRAPNCLGNYPHALIDISAYKNANCQVRFIYEDGNDWAWYVGIDNVSIYTLANNDLSLISFTPIQNSCNLTDSLSVRVVNRGFLPQSNFSIAYQLNGTSVVSANFSSTLNQGDTALFTFPNLLTYNSGINNLSVFTDLSNEENPANDTLNLSITKSATLSLPYLEDFESNTQDWQVSGQRASWEIGPPNTTKLNNAAGGQNAAVTNLDSTYNNDEFSYITSPCLQLAGVSDKIRVRFDAMREIEAGLDGVWLEYSINGGQNWTKVINNSGYRSTNWYNDTSQQLWDGDRTNGYYQSSIVIGNIQSNANLRFRMVMRSDRSTQLEGFAFDNFEVSELPRTDVSIININRPNNMTCRLEFINPEIQVENLGADTLFDCEFFYQVNNGIVIRDSLRSPLLPGALISFDFSQAFNFDTISTIQFKSWSNATGDTVNFNDTLASTFNNLPSAAFQAPYTADFSQILGGQASTNWTAPLNDTVNNRGWRNDFSTFADADGDGLAIQLIPMQNVKYSLVSPCIDIDTLDEAELQFAFINSFPTNSEIYVQVFSAGKWFTVDSITKATNFASLFPWRYQGISLNRFKNQTIKIRFMALKTASMGSIMIDDLRIIDPGSNPLDLKRLILDSASCRYGAQASVKVRLREYISDTLSLDSLSFELYQNGTLISTENLQNDLVGLRGDTFFVLNQKPNLNQYSQQQIKVISKLNYKGRLYIDSLERTTQVLYDQLPYFEGFESTFIDCWENLDRSFEIFDQSSGWSLEYYRAPFPPFTSIFTRAIWHVTDTTQCIYRNNNRGNATWPNNTGPNSPLEGKSFIYTDVGRPTDSSYLYSPCFDLANYSQAVVEYYHHRYYHQYYIGEGILKLEVKQGNNWILIDRVDSTWNAPSSPWQKRSIDISSYLGSNVQLRFYVDSTLGNSHSTPLNTAIDAFKIYDPLVTDVEYLESQTQTLAIYPNPNNGHFNLEVPKNLIGERYEIYNLSGKTLKSGNLNRSIEQIQIDAEKGVYILRVPEHGVHQKVVVY